MPRRGTDATEPRRIAPLLLGLAFLAAPGPAAESGASRNAPVTPFEAVSAPAPAGGAAVAPHPDTLAKLAARRYGAAAFHRVGALHYTFKVRFQGKDVERRWTWFPRQDSVLYSGKDTAGLAVTAAWSRRNRFSMESPSVKPLDRWFVNDRYWLLFPLHLAWDKGLRLESAAAPSGAGAGEAWRLTAVYPAEGGYTPGDAYDLFLDTAGTVKRWIYRKGNAPGPTREARWSAPAAIGPLWISLERRGPEGDFRLWFEDVRVTPRPPSDPSGVSGSPGG